MFLFNCVNQLMCLCLNRSEELSGQMQLVQREEIEDDEDMFETIDKRIFSLS